jgi:hypothetical protein
MAVQIARHSDCARVWIADSSCFVHDERSCSRAASSAWRAEMRDFWLFRRICCLWIDGEWLLCAFVVEGILQGMLAQCVVVCHTDQVSK